MKVFWILLALCLLPVDIYAKVHRSPATVRAFKRLHPCPATHKKVGSCPGWIVDHIKALACDGADSTANMQWQSYADSQAKDRWEIKGDVIHAPCSGLPK